MEGVLHLCVSGRLGKVYMHLLSKVKLILGQTKTKMGMWTLVFGMERL